MLIVRPNVVEALVNLGDGRFALRKSKFCRRLDLDKQQGELTLLNKGSDSEVDGFSRVRNVPLGTNVVSFIGREPMF